MHVSVAEVVSYQIIIELDHKIRTFPVPITLQPPSPEYPMQKWPDDPAGALQQFCFLGEREMSEFYGIACPKQWIAAHTDLYIRYLVFASQLPSEGDYRST